MATLFFTTGSQQEVAPADGVAFTLAELQGFVGGFIEFVYLADGRALVLDEEGKLTPHPVVNVAATRLAHDGVAIFADDCLVGDVLLLTISELDAGKED